jgi:hypothetical protein
MSHPYHHAVSSARRFSGQPEDYQALHDFFDSTKAGYAHFTHRAILHNTFGIFLAEKLFGTTILNSDGKHVPTRLLGEQHVREDLGWIPTIKDWMSAIVPTEWMRRGVAHAGDDSIPDQLKVVAVMTPAQAESLLLLAGLDTGIRTQLLKQLAA